MALANRQNVSNSRELDPLTPTHLAGGGGWRDEKTLVVRAFLALRQYFPWLRGLAPASQTLRATQWAKRPKHAVFPESFATVGNTVRHD